jgi:hypothetical protein
MQLAAPLSIGLLGWYAWYETKSKFWLFDIYFFTAVATLAKGPVAPFLVLVIVGCFAALRTGVVDLLEVAVVAGDRALLRHRIAMVYRGAAPESDLFPGVLPGAQPGAICDQQIPACAACLVLPGGRAAGDDAVDGNRDAGARGWVRVSIIEWRIRHARTGTETAKKIGVSRPGDAFPEFLVLWALIPIVFFSSLPVQAAGIHSAVDCRQLRF